MTYNDMSETEIKEIVKNEIGKFVKDELDREIKRALSKSNSQSRSEVITTIKNAMEGVYKMLWQKRDFWKTEIK